MTRFTDFLAVDWSGAKGPRQKGIALALAKADGGAPRLLPPPDRKGWAREEVLALLFALSEPTLIGLDLGISLPHADAGAFFPGWDASPADARGLWALIDALCAEDPHLEAGSFVTPRPRATSAMARITKVTASSFPAPPPAKAASAPPKPPSALPACGR